MSQENVQVLKQGYEAFQRGDFDAAFANFADDVVVRGGSDSIPAGGTYHGLDELRGRWLQEFGATYADFRMTIEETIDAGDWTVVLGTSRGQLQKTSEELKSPFCHVWRWKGDKIVEARFFTDSARLLSAIQNLDRTATA